MSGQLLLRHLPYVTQQMRRLSSPSISTQGDFPVHSAILAPRLQPDLWFCDRYRQANTCFQDHGVQIGMTYRWPATALRTFGCAALSPIQIRLELIAWPF